MAFELALGFILIIMAMGLHLCSTIAVVHVVRPLEFLIKLHPYIFVIVTLMLTNLIFFLTQLLGVTMWATVYLQLNLVSNFSEGFYSAFIMNTTLGTGLIKPEIGVRLLAPLNASSGIMMIGWSTAVFIYVVQSYLPHIARRD